MPEEIPATCDGCSKIFSNKQSISYPMSSFVLERHNDAAKEWVLLGDQALVPGAITYKPKSNSRTVHWERTGAGARQESGTASGGADIVGEAKEGSVRTVNRLDILVGRQG